MIKYIIFDLDGVLFDGCEFHANMFMEALSTILGKTSITKEYHDTHLNGLSTKKKLEVLQIGKEETQRISDLKQELTKTNIHRYIRPDVKVQMICIELLKLGYTLYCVSNSIRQTIITCLEGIGVLHLFTCIISNEDVKEQKPSPEPYLTLYKKYNMLPSECLIIEDSPHGIESATKSGGNVLTVLNCNDLTLDKIIDKLNM